MKAAPSLRTCERVRAQVSLRLDAELSQLELRMLETHLDRCADCREFSADVDAFTSELRAAPLESLSRPIAVSRTRRVSLSGVQVGVAAVVAIALFGVANRVAVDGVPQPAASRAATEQLFTTSWQPERELADLANAPKTTNRSPQGPQTAI